MGSGPPNRANASRPWKKASDEARTVVWVDQSGFFLLPLAVRTWAPYVQTPLLRVPLTHDYLSAISGIIEVTPAARPNLATRLMEQGRSALHATGRSCIACCQIVAHPTGKCGCVTHAYAGTLTLPARTPSHTVKARGSPMVKASATRT